MKVLLHTCCAPCFIGCLDYIKDENYDITAYWYNPNIHPYMEYKNRLDSLKSYVEQNNIKATYEEEYGLRSFVKNVSDDINGRCVYCYKVRIEQTAQFAKENGYDGFSTTLLISPYQNHELIKKIANEMAEKYNVKFIYHDFRLNFRNGQKIARELEVYMQKYCGCVFSEEDRYLKKR